MYSYANLSVKLVQHTPVQANEAVESMALIAIQCLLSHLKLTRGHSLYPHVVRDKRLAPSNTVEYTIVSWANNLGRDAKLLQLLGPKY